MELEASKVKEAEEKYKQNLAKIESSRVIEGDETQLLCLICKEVVC
jgi:hypothetical protein